MRSSTRYAVIIFAVLAAACDLFDPPPRIAAIEIASDADTVPFRFPDEPPLAIHLTAVVKDGAGNIVEGNNAVTWSAADRLLTVNSTGARTADVVLNPTSPEIASSVEVVASLGEVTARKTLVVCAGAQMAAKNSGTLLLGRTVELHAALYGFVDGGLFSPNVFDTPIGWRSSAPGVVSVAGNTATAVGVGEAMLTASACSRSDAVSVRVVPSGYQVTAITAWGSDTTVGFDLNDDGQVVGSVKTPTGFSYFIWEAGTATNLAPCFPRDLNNRGKVLCAGAAGAQPMIWEAGGATARDTLTFFGQAINDSGYVASSDRIWRGPGNTSPIAPQSGLANRSAKGMNNRNDVVGTQSGGLYAQPALWRGSGRIDLGIFGRQGIAWAVNDSGDVVGSSENLSGGGRQNVALFWPAAMSWAMQLLRPPRVLLTNDVATNAAHINNLRQIVGSGSQGAFAWEAGRLTLLRDVITDPDWSLTGATRINIHGQILAQARNTRTGQLVAVLLTPE